jgi:putative permease
MLSDPRADNADGTKPLPLSHRGSTYWLGPLALLILAALLVWALKPVLLLFAIVFLLAIVLNPIVAFLERKGLKRGWAVGLLLLAFAGLLAFALLFLVPPLLDQFGELIRQVPQVWGRLRSQVETWGLRYPEVQRALPAADQVVSGIGQRTGDLMRILAQSAFSVVGGVLGLVFGLLLLVFVLSDPQPLVARYLALVPNRHRDNARRTLARLMAQMAAWARGVVINGTLMGVSTGVALGLIGVQPALVFGVLAFVGEFVPMIGPIVMSFPALLVALSLGPGKFVGALVAILIIQQVEQNLLVPFIFGQAMDLHPANILFFTLAMSSLFGLAGAVLAVPAAALFKIVVDEFYLSHRSLDQARIEAQARHLVSAKRGEAE